MHAKVRSVNELIEPAPKSGRAQMIRTEDTGESECCIAAAQLRYIRQAFCSSAQRVEYNLPGT
jgi:hypothetical protein